MFLTGVKWKYIVSLYTKIEIIVRENKHAQNMDNQQQDAYSDDSSDDEKHMVETNITTITKTMPEPTIYVNSDVPVCEENVESSKTDQDVN